MEYTFVLCPTKYRAGATWHIVDVRYSGGTETWCGQYKPIHPACPRTDDRLEVWGTGLALCARCDLLSWRNARRWLDRLPDSYEPVAAGDLAVGERVRWYDADREILTRRSVGGRGPDSTPPKRWVALGLSDWPADEVRFLTTTRLLRSRHARCSPDPTRTAGTAN